VDVTTGKKRHHTGDLKKNFGKEKREKGRHTTSRALRKIKGGKGQKASKRKRKKNTRN